MDLDKVVIYSTVKISMVMARRRNCAEKPMPVSVTEILKIILHYSLKKFNAIHECGM